MLGHGLGPAIVITMERNFPVLVSVNGLKLPAFLTYTAGISEMLEPGPENSFDWVRLNFAAESAMLSHGVV